MRRRDDSSDEAISSRRRSRSPHTSLRHRYSDSRRVYSERDLVLKRPDKDREGYKILCVSGIHHKADEDMIRDEIYAEFRRYPDVYVKFVIEHDGERVAYVYFRSHDDAREAKRAAKGHVKFFGRAATIESVYDTAANDYLFQKRTKSPYGLMDYHMEAPTFLTQRTTPLIDYDRYSLAVPPSLDPYTFEMPPHDPFAYARAYPYRDMSRHPMFGGYTAPLININRPVQRYERQERKERFPNYLHHVTPEDDPTACRTLFAGNMELNISETEVRRIFGKFGVIEDVDIKRPVPGAGNAFAFVRFQTLDQSFKCKQELSGQYIGKFQVKIGYGKQLPSCKVWVGGLGAWATTDLLEREFDRFGVIRRIEYTKGDTTAHVLYESLDAAQAAVSEMRGFSFGGADKRIRTDFANDGSVSSQKYSRRATNNSGAGGNSLEGSTSGGYPGSGRSSTNQHSAERGSNRAANQADTTSSHSGSRSPRATPTHSPPHHTARARTAVSSSKQNVSRSDTAQVTQDSGDTTVSATTQQQQEVAAEDTLDGEHALVWHGSLVLKSSLFCCKFYRLDGDAAVFGSLHALLCDEAKRPRLRISQRLRLDQAKIQDVRRRISLAPHLISVAVPAHTSPAADTEIAGAGGSADLTVSVQSRSLRNLVSYLKQKEAAGVISLGGCSSSSTSQNTDTNAAVLYAFPPCDFSIEMVSRHMEAARQHEVLKDDYLLVAIVKASN